MMSEQKRHLVGTMWPKHIGLDDECSEEEIMEGFTSEWQLLESLPNLRYLGGLLGAAAFAGIYSLTYPITFIDGPLPIVDAAWAFGMVRFMRSGHAIGGEVGSWLD